MITVLAIDQSLRQTGVVVRDVMYHAKEDRHHAEVIHSEIIKTKKTDKEDWLVDAHERSVKIATRIGQIADEHKITHVVVEQPSLGSSGRSTRTLPFLLGIILSIFTEFTYVPPSALKKFATGSGNAEKDEMVTSIEPVDKEFFDYIMSLPKTAGRYDLADAFWLSEYLAKNL